MVSEQALRRYFEHDGLRLSYLDTGAHADTSPDPGTSPGTSRDPDQPVLLALHGHLNEARFIEQGAVPRGLPHRIIALDQRGHGESDHAPSYRVEEYVGDALALLDHLSVGRASVLGHSLGGVIAYTVAAREPDRVDALVVVDIGAEIAGDLTVTQTWPRRAPTRQALVDAFGFMGAKQEYVMREYPDGWGVPWDADDMVASQLALNGDRWTDWLATSMPALLVHGRSSRELSEAHALEMARRRENTQLAEFDAGHAVYVDARDEYSRRVRGFVMQPM